MEYNDDYDYIDEDIDLEYIDEDIKYNKDKPEWFKDWQVKFYHSKKWLDLRDRVVKDRKLVSDKSHKIIKTIPIVDHIKPITIYNYRDESITLNLDNLQLLSIEEHNLKHYGTEQERNYYGNKYTIEDMINALIYNKM